jgi:DNA modification methylase
MTQQVTLYHGDTLDYMERIPAASIDAIISDPPYPEINRPYGSMTEAGWTEMMHEVVRQSRRVLKPHGSAVFVLQPNSRSVGSMRPWLWEFMAWVCHEWNMVQDVWWWNVTALPVGGAITGGLTRGSLKACVWVGEPNCYRNQDAVLWTETESNVKARMAGRIEKRISPSGRTVNTHKAVGAALRRGGVTPYNVLPYSNNWKPDHSGNLGHGASTPLALCDWWVRYITQPGWTVLDPFAGTSTVGVAALKHCCSYIGIDKEAEYIEISQARLDEAQQQPLLFEG